MADILAQIVWSRGRPVYFLKDVLLILQDIQQDSTGCPLEFCKFASNDLELPISSINAIKNFTGCPVEILLDIHQNLQDVQQNWSTGCPLEQKIWRIIQCVLRIQTRIEASLRVKSIKSTKKRKMKIVNPICTLKRHQFLRV